VKTEFRVNGRKDLDTGEAGHGRSEVSMDVAMVMATVVTSIATETAGKTNLSRWRAMRMRSGEAGARPQRPPATGAAAWRGQHDIRHRN